MSGLRGTAVGFTVRSWSAVQTLHAPMWAMVLGVVEKVGNSYLSVEPGFAFILVFLKGNKSMRERTFGRYCVLATVQKQFVSCARQLHKYRQCRGHPGSLLCLLL